MGFSNAPASDENRSVRNERMVSSTAHDQAVTADSKAPSGLTVAQGTDDTAAETAFVQASAEYPSDQKVVAAEWAQSASAGIARSVGIAA